MGRRLREKFFLAPLQEQLRAYCGMLTFIVPQTLYIAYVKNDNPIILHVIFFAGAGD